MNKSNLFFLMDVALPKYLHGTVTKLDSSPFGEVMDLETVFHELTTQLMGRMAYNVSHVEDASKVIYHANIFRWKCMQTIPSRAVLNMPPAQLEDGFKTHCGKSQRFSPGKSSENRSMR